MMLLDISLEGNTSGKINELRLNKDDLNFTFDWQEDFPDEINQNKTVQCLGII